MSAAAKWSYTATATVWPLLDRGGWEGVEAFGPPFGIVCDYSGEARTLTDGKGREFVSRLTLYTERSDLKQGDRIMLGASVVPSPISAGALEVRMVRQHADTFDRRADDFEVVA